MEFLSKRNVLKIIVIKKKKMTVTRPKRRKSQFKECGAGVSEVVCIPFVFKISWYCTGIIKLN